jgi:hypothetical protein
MRRGAAWPAERPSSRLVVREHKHGWASQRAVAPWRPRWSGRRLCCRYLSAFVSSVWRPVQASGVLRIPVQVTVSGADV